MPFSSATLTSAPPPRLDTASRDDLRAYFQNTWDLYEMLKRSIRDEATFYLAPDPLRHPLIFYLGHTAVFYVNKLKACGAIPKGLNSRFETLFAVGVDPEDKDQLDNGIDWPSIAEVWAYRESVKSLVLETIDQLDLQDHPDQSSAQWGLHMALEHERIHFETSSVLIRQYTVDLLQRPAGWEYAPSEAPDLPEQRFVAFPASQVRLGKPQDFPTYGWDNEYGDLEVSVPSFEACNLMVTNGEFLKFVQHGGYQNRAYWTDESWAWKDEKGLTAPAFWVSDGSDFRYRAMFDEMSLPLDWPVEATAYEAQAYLAWLGKGYRLLTEAEWKVISNDVPEVDGDCIFSDCHNLNLHYGSPSPVGFMQDGCSTKGLYDVHGNVWDWLSDDHYPLPGFTAHPWYGDFSAPFMDSQHGMLLGGSWASCGTSASKYYRLWFRRGFLQHAGFRLARSL